MLEYPVFKNKKIGYLFLLPTLIVLLVFLYYPFWEMLITSFYRSNIIVGSRIFNGIQNYSKLFSGPFAASFKQVFIQNLFFIFLVGALGISISLVLARLLTLSIRGLLPYQILILLTFALSPAVAGLVFSYLFNPELGLVNRIIFALFRVKPNWFASPILAMCITIAGLVWKNLGYNVVFYIAALQNIPKELEDAASVDGAGSLRKFFSITVPLVSPTTMFLLFTNLGYVVFESFGFIDVLTRGGPVGKNLLGNAGATSTIMYKIFQEGFGGSGNIGSAAAQSMLLFILVMGLTILNYRISKKKVQYGENN